MLSKKAKYAIRALIVLGENYDKPPMKISVIAEKGHIPKKFLEQILLLLRNSGLLSSKKGAHGGYSLSRDSREIYMAQIMRVTDGPIAMVPCVSLNFYSRCAECKEEKTCGIRDVFMDVRDVTLKILAETSVFDMMQREKELRGDKSEFWD